MSETGTMRVTGEDWVDLNVGATVLSLQNTGPRTVVIAVASSAPEADTWLGMHLKPCCEPTYINLDDGDNVYARVYSSQHQASSTVAWHEVDPPA